jgi:hypothetical protein
MRRVLGFAPPAGPSCRRYRTPTGHVDGYWQALLQSFSKAPQLLWQVIDALPSIDDSLPPELQATLQFATFASHWLTHVFSLFVVTAGPGDGADVQAAATVHTTPSSHA